MSILVSRLLQKEFLTSSKVVHYLCKNYAQPKIQLNMKEALLKHDDGSNEVNISFRYVNTDIHLDRQFNFRRQLNEAVNTFYQRAQMNIDSIVAKKMKRLKQTQKKKLKSGGETNTLPKHINIEDIKIQILKNDSVIDSSVPWKSILEDASNLKLIIINEEYTMKLNIPSVIGIALPSSILAGFPTYPTKFETVYTDKSKCVFHWYKKPQLGPQKWTQVGEGYMYIPDVSDIGCKLKITCLPKSETQTGPSVEVESNSFVEASPGSCPFETRHGFTKNKLTGNSFRVVSYNILADIYSESDYSKYVLYPYCAPYALNMDYRKLLIMKELIGFNADIICLQEVDTKIYEKDLEPLFSSFNYESVYNTKNDQREGLSVFFNHERFNKLNSEHSAICHGTDLDEFRSVWSQIQNEKVKERFLKRSTIVQAVTLQSKEDSSKILVVGNTHLYFRPDADHIRLLQAYYALMYLSNQVKKVKEENPNSTISTLLCGDFNSVPECGVYKLMTERYVPEDTSDWRHENPDEILENLTLKHDFNLSSACGTPEYTNYTPGFSGCLDYIFYQKDHLEVEQVIPMPSKEEITLHTGLPSIVFPSDHISLCADLKWSQ